MPPRPRRPLPTGVNLTTSPHTMYILITLNDYGRLGMHTCKMMYLQPVSCRSWCTRLFISAGVSYHGWSSILSHTSRSIKFRMYEFCMKSHITVEGINSFIDTGLAKITYSSRTMELRQIGTFKSLYSWIASNMVCYRASYAASIWY